MASGFGFVGDVVFVDFYGVVYIVVLIGGYD
jgi:hypothetical protein